MSSTETMAAMRPQRGDRGAGDGGLRAMPSSTMRMRLLAARRGDGSSEVHVRAPPGDRSGIAGFRAANDLRFALQTHVRGQPLQVFGMSARRTPALHACARVDRLVLAGDAVAQSAQAAMRFANA